jgi:hypothetical protein
MPAVFLGEAFDATVNAVIVPSERDQDPLSAFLHGAHEDDQRVFIFQLIKKNDSSFFSVPRRLVQYFHM